MIAVQVKNENQFNTVKEKISNVITNWLPIMQTVPTAIVIESNNHYFPIGSVGSIKYQSKYNIKIITFEEYEKNTN